LFVDVASFGFTFWQAEKPGKHVEAWKTLEIRKFNRGRALTFIVLTIESIASPTKVMD